MGTASFSFSSWTVTYTGAAWANSGKTTRRTGRQGQDHVRAGRVDVHLLAEAVAVEKERPRPALGERRQGKRLEGDRDHVARLRDHEQVVGLAQQLAHVTQTRVAPRHGLPGRDE